MLISGRVARAVIAGCAVAALAGCTSGGTGPSPKESGPTISVDAMRSALLQASDVGSTWSAPDATPSATTLVSFCGGGASSPPVPGSPSLVVASLADQGTAGAQTFDQIALVYDGRAAASSGLATLRGLADACPASVSRPAQPRDDSMEAAYTESAATSPLTSGGWSGFVVLRNKQYEPKNPGTADTAVAVLAMRNVVLVADYAIYRVGAHSTGPNFTTDWQKLVASVLKRVVG
jgi:hypothetical protein